METRGATSFSLPSMGSQGLVMMETAPHVHTGRHLFGKPRPRKLRHDGGSVREPRDRVEKGGCEVHQLNNLTIRLGAFDSEPRARSPAGPGRHVYDLPLLVSVYTTPARPPPPAATDLPIRCQSAR